MQESGPGSSDIHSVLNPNINRSSGFINKNQTQLYKSKMYVRLWVTQPWQWDIFQTTLTPDIGSKKTFTPSHCLNESHTPSEKSKQKPTNLAHVQTVLQADNFYPLITDILQKNNQYPKNTKQDQVHLASRTHFVDLVIQHICSQKIIPYFADLIIHNICSQKIMPYFLTNYRHQ